MEKCSNTTSKIIGIKWTVEDVSKKEFLFKFGPDLYLTSECMFQISFEKKRNYAYVYLYNKSNTNITIERRIAILDNNDKKLHEENDASIFLLEKGKNVNVFKGSDLKYYQTLSKELLKIDLCVSIKEIEGKKFNRLKCDMDRERKLREDLKTMLENPVNSDISLQVGDERIPAHWSVLCARSPYFKRMFDSGMLESGQNSITITDLSIGAVKNLIQFLYTADFVEKDIQKLFDLYCAADKYEAVDLKTLCGCKIISSTMTANVCEILQFSSNHNDKDLKMEAIGFIRSHSDAVFQTEGWKNFVVSEPETAELISFCLKKN